MRPINYETVIKQGKPFERQLKSFIKEAKPHLSGLYASRLRRRTTSRNRKRIFLPSFRHDPVAEQMLWELDAIAEQNIAYDEPSKSKDDEITGVIAIDRIFETLQYLLQRDTIKQRGMIRWNFPGGGREKNETPMMTLHREHMEENHIDIMRNTVEEISNIRLRARTPEEPRAYSKVYFVVLYEEQLLEMEPGEEQEELGCFTEEEIEKFIREDAMPVNHINAWRAYQWWRNNLPR